MDEERSSDTEETFGSQEPPASVSSQNTEGKSLRELGGRGMDAIPAFRGPEARIEMMDRQGIAGRAGHHCAQPILRRFGVEASVRASLALYNTHADVEAPATSLRRIRSGRTAMV